MQEQQAEPGRRPAQQFPTVDLRRPKGYAAAPASPQPAAPAATPPAAVDGDPCPRCESRDTKFCYFNNYNTSQPRHFCKGCRRYWTKGGTLRNVPVGGGTRKKPSSSSSSSSSSSAASASATKRQKPSKKRRVDTPPEPAADTSVPTPTAATAAADDSANTTEELTEKKTVMTPPPAPDTASEITTELVVPAVEEDSFTDLLQPDSTAVTLGLDFSDYPSVTKGLADPDLHFEWPPATFDMASLWPASAGFADPDPTALFLNLP